MPPAEAYLQFNILIGYGSFLAAILLPRDFLPLLRMDAVPEFVHLVKLCQQEFGLGSERVRPPRLVLSGPVREQALLEIAEAKMSHAPV